MVAAKRLGPARIVAPLRDAERLQAQGATHPQVCKKVGVPEQTRHTSSGRPFRVLSVIVESSSWAKTTVRAHMEWLFAARGRPTLIRADNGREIIVVRPLNWLGSVSLSASFRRLLFRVEREVGLAAEWACDGPASPDIDLL